MTKRFFLGGVLAAALVLGSFLGVLAPSVAADGAKKGPVVVELYTSQGCNTCPPADRFLGDLAGRKDVIALSFHVDYWDYIGWKDPFASAASTQRQRRYRLSLRQSYVYTPQMVIGGVRHRPGFRRNRVMSDIGYIRMDRKADIAVTLVRRADGGMTAAIGASDSVSAGDIWLFLFDKSHTTAIGRGENSGKKLTYHHVVREIRKAGSYSGAGQTLSLSTLGADGKRRYGAVVVVQTPRFGPILGAAMAKLK